MAIHAATLVEWAMARYLRPVWLDRTVIALINTLLSDGIVLAAAAVLLLRAGKYGKGRRSWAAVGFAIAAYLTFLPFLGALVMALTAFFRFIQYEPAPQPVFTIYFSESRLPVIGWLLVLVTVIGPVAEEFFFRGLLYGWLRTRVGILSGLLFSAFIFALLHASWVAFAPIFALGLLFGWVYEQTGTLAAPMAIHVLHNGAMLYGAFLMKTLMRLGSP